MIEIFSFEPVKGIAYAAEETLDEILHGGSADISVKLDILNHELKNFEDEAIREELMGNNDLAELREDINNISELVNMSKQSTGLRSWENNAIVRNDAIDYLNAMKIRWGKKYKAYTDNISTKNVPTYKYTIGETVKLSSNERRTGKVIGIRREDGYGRALYTVRFYDDKENEYPGSQLKKL